MTPEDNPFMYGSLYSTAGIVLYYLIRVMPFTQVAATEGTER